MLDPPKPSFTQRFSERFLKFEVAGYKAANKLHRGFVNCVLLFMVYNSWVFIRQYNDYWRLRRDSELPAEWTEEAPKAGFKDWRIEKDRAERDRRIKEVNTHNETGKMNVQENNTKRSFYD